MSNIKKTMKRIREKEFIPIVLMGFLMLSITWGARLAGIKYDDGAVVSTARAQAPDPSAAAEAPSRPPITTIAPNLYPLKVGHRGVRKLAPENTLPSMRKAMAMGYNYVEIDVQYTSDNVPVIMHDPTMQRTAGSPDTIAMHTLAEIKKQDAGAWFGKDFAGTRIPTVEEFLKEMQGRIKLYLDQKAPPRPVLIELLKKYNFYPDNIVVVGGSDMEKKFLEIAPGAPVMPDLDLAADIDKVLAEFPTAVAFNTVCGKDTPAMVKKAHERGVMIFANVLFIENAMLEKDCMKTAINAGADALQFDSPDILNNLLEEMRRKAAAKAKKP